MIRVFNRHCVNSEASAHKSRPENFNRKKLFLDLLQSADSAHFTVFLDKKANEAHFTESIFVEHVTRNVPPTPFTIVTKECGSEALAYLALMDYIKEQEYDSNDIIVIIEDDYKVQSNWKVLVKDGLQFGSYVSLYDHPDKYSVSYKDLQVKLFKGLRHWRTSPSTTNTFAVRVKTLMEDMDAHKTYSTGTLITDDHSKFLHLWSKHRSLVTCIPGAWSHEETNMQIPIDDPVPQSEPVYDDQPKVLGMSSNSNLKLVDFVKGGFEGNVSDCAEKAHDLACLARNKRRAIQIGFNAGHSADIILGANSDITLVSFDIGKHGYVSAAEKFIDLKYPGRHKLILGNSKHTFPSFAKNNSNFDFIFIDGGHKYDEVQSDFQTALLVSSQKSVIILDDTCFNPKWDKNYTIYPTRVWRELLASKQIEVIETKDYKDGYGMAWCKPTKKSDAKEAPLELPVMPKYEKYEAPTMVPKLDLTSLPPKTSEEPNKPEMAYFH
jgi:predicted O-methyltransferase YrrM